MKKAQFISNEMRNGHTLFLRIAIPLFVVMVLLSTGFYGSTVFGGVISMLDENAEGVLQERVNNKETDLSSTFASQWADFAPTVSAIDADYNKITEGGTESLYDSTDKQKKLLSSTFEDMTDMLRSNSVTGTFLILNNSKTFSEAEAGHEDTLYGVCVRDYDPTSNYTDKEDLMLDRCPSSMVGKVGVSVDSWWEANYVFDGSIDDDYFYRPLEQAYLNPQSSYDNLAFFCKPHTFGQTDHEVVTYSVPLIDDHGYAYGVLGVELTVDYLKTLISGSPQSNATDGCYVLALNEEGSEEYTIIAGEGPLYMQALDSTRTFNAKTSQNGLLNFTSSQVRMELCGCSSAIPIYNHNTPFENQHLLLVGFAKRSALYNVSSLVQSRIFTISTVLLLIGLLVAFFICRRVTKPINDLSAKVRTMDDDEAPMLDRIGISEIDDLVESIETLGIKVNRNMVRTEFFSRMSHDMRTPMNAVIGFSSPELVNEATPEQLHAYLNKIHTSGTYLLGLINEVLDMTKIEADRMTVRREPVDGHVVWLGVVDMISRVAEQRGVEFVPHVAENDYWFYTDRLHLEQILMNLLSNAVKFTPEHGKVTYGVSCEGADEEKVSYCITVADTGCGMSEEFLEKMYEPFAQEHANDSVASGTGLGLAITKQMIELMGGTIDCVSVKDEGTTFTVHLPFERTEAPASVSGMQTGTADDASQIEADVFEGKHILLCDDSALNSEIAQALLERRGMSVTCASDGVEGVEAFEQSSEGFFDVILMDILMPRMNGLEATRTIRALEREDAATVPIFAMTANAFAEDVEKSAAAGMNEHLSKPIDPDILYTTLETYLSRG